MRFAAPTVVDEPHDEREKTRALQTAQRLHERELMKTLGLLIALTTTVIGCAAAPRKASDPTNTMQPSSLPIVYVKGACSTDLATVFADDRGRYLGSIRPGQSTTLEIPEGVHVIHAMSTVEVARDPGTFHEVTSITVDPRPEGGLVLHHQVGGKCLRTQHYAHVHYASQQEILERQASVATREYDPFDQQWLDAHRTRVDEILAAHDKDVDGSSQPGIAVH